MDSQSSIVKGFGSITDETLMLRRDKQDGFDYRRRRDMEWTENYELYRGKPRLNRLTQRQSVHIPLMKQQLQNVLKDTDDMPVLYFENLDNDKQAELFKNQYWKYTVDFNNLELQDIIDKKQQYLNGRTFDQWNIINGQIRMQIEDTMDFLVPRFNDPMNLSANRSLIHTHIFRTFNQLEANPDYDQKEVARLKAWYGTEMGLIKAAENAALLADKNLKLYALGIIGVDNPILSETYVELTMYFRMEKQSGDQYEQFYLYVEADNMVTLMKKPLEEVIGVTKDHYWRTHLPYNSWASDVEKQDFWSDGIGDIVRQINKVVNVWFSQLIENRTLKSLNMFFYDGTAGGGDFTPQTWQPQAFGFYKMPGPPQNVLQPAPIGDLKDSIEEMQYLVSTAEQAAGPNPTQSGILGQSRVTLGEVQLVLQEAKQRIKALSKFYTNSWQNRGEIFIKLIEAAPDKLDPVKIYVKGRNSNNIYSREISPTDWEAKAGYHCKVWSQEEKDTQDLNQIQIDSAALQNMPDNPVVVEEFQRKLLDRMKLSPDKVQEAMKYEEQKRANMANQPQQPGAPGMSGNGTQPPPPLQLPQPQSPLPYNPVTTTTRNVNLMPPNK